MNLGEDFLKVFLNDYQWIIPLILAVSGSVWYIFGQKTKSEKYFALKRIAWTGFTFIFSLTIVMIILHLFVYPGYKFHPDKSGILVLRIEGDDENNSLQLDLVSRLNEELDRKEFEVRASNEFVSKLNIGGDNAHNITREIGQKLNAHLVIWGEVAYSVKFRPEITVVEDIAFVLIKDNFSLTAQTIKDMTLPPEVTNKPICLINFINGYNLYNKKDYANALPFFRNSLEIQDTELLELNDLRFLIGNLNFRLAKIDQDSVHLNEAIVYYNKTIELNPEYVEVYNNRGAAKFEKGLYDEAIRDFNIAIEINPKVGVAYNNRGIANGKKGLYDEEISDYSRAIKINPKYANAYYNRGLAKSEKDLYDEAIMDYNMAIEINPDFVEAYYNRGFAKSKKGLYDEAIIDYNTVIEINPKYANAYYYRGFAKSEKGLYDEAIIDYNTEIELNPNSANAYYNRGLAKYEKGLYDEAIIDCNMAIEINPDFAEAYCNRGDAKFKKHFFYEAIIDYNKAIEINPDFVEAYCNRGNPKAGLGFYNLAISDYNRAIELNPGYVEVYYNKALVCEKINQINDALEAYRKFIQIAPSNFVKQIEKTCQRVNELEKQ